MNTTGNTILITGGGSGIGRGLAEAFHKLGNHVIIAGRRKQVLDETVTANPGMSSAVLDIENAASIRAFAAKLIADFPALNAVILNAGIMRPENVLAEPWDLSDAEATITTNLLGPIRLTAALLPHFVKQPHASILTVTSYPHRTSPVLRGRWILEEMLGADVPPKRKSCAGSLGPWLV